MEIDFNNLPVDPNKDNDTASDLDRQWQQGNGSVIGIWYLRKCVGAEGPPLGLEGISLEELIQCKYVLVVSVRPGVRMRRWGIRSMEDGERLAQSMGLRLEDRRQSS